PMADLSGIAGDRPRRADPTSHAQVPGRDLYFGGYCFTCGGSVDLSAFAHHFSWSVAGPVMTASGPASPSGGTWRRDGSGAGGGTAKNSGSVRKRGRQTGAARAREDSSGRPRA